MLVCEREATHGLKLEETENVVHRLATRDVYPKTTDAAPPNSGPPFPSEMGISG